MWRFIHQWHKRLGIISALFVILLSLTGIILNHTETLGIQDQFIQNQLLLDAYKIGPKESLYGFQANDQWITRVDDRIYFNQQLLAKDTSGLTGVVLTEEYYVIATDNKIFLVTETGEVIEKLTSSEGVPPGIKQIGKSYSGDVIVRTSHGDYSADFENADWQKLDQTEALWSHPGVIPDALQKRLLELYRGTGLSVERIMLDIHSGRIIGDWGVYLVDFMAALFFMLALSGSWMWFKQR